MIPYHLFLNLETILLAVLELCYSNLGKDAKNHLPLILSIFNIVLFINLIGMIPYSFTVTSHLIVTFSLASTIYIGLNIIGGKKHHLHFFNLLLPSGASLALVPLLVPIEFVSYVFRVISLPVRLFANMMAGHTLLKVIAGFSWIMIHLNFILFLIHFIPLLLLVLLIGLELGVAVIQSFVFSILSCMYINDAINLH